MRRSRTRVHISDGNVLEIAAEPQAVIGHLAGWRNEPESNLNSIEVDAGTRLEERIDVEPSGVLRLLTPLIKGRMESDFKVSHARMKERVEALA